MTNEQDITAGGVASIDPTIELYASTFHDEPDSMGDIIRFVSVTDNAFSRWLTKFKSDPESVLAVVWSHDWKSAHAVIGYAKGMDISIDSTGLLVRCHLDPLNPTAMQVWRNAKSGAVRGASFSYGDVTEHRVSSTVNSLDHLNVIEVGPCLVGANSHAGVTSAKSITSTKAKALAVKDSIRRGKLEYIASAIRAHPRELPAELKAEIEDLGIPLSFEDELDAIAAKMAYCRKGHMVPPYKVHVRGTYPATYCAPCDQWQVKTPRADNISDAGVRGQISTLIDYANRRKSGRRVEQAKARADLRAMGLSEPTEAELGAQLAQIERAVEAKKTWVERELDALEKSLTDGFHWGA